MAMPESGLITPSEIRTGLRFEINVLPEVAQLAFVFARDEERWTLLSAIYKTVHHF
jgi:hypothetical protein